MFFPNGPLNVSYNLIRKQVCLVIEITLTTELQLIPDTHFKKKISRQKTTEKDYSCGIIIPVILLYHINYKKVIITFHFYLNNLFFSKLLRIKSAWRSELFVIFACRQSDAFFATNQQHWTIKQWIKVTHLTIIKVRTEPLSCTDMAKDLCWLFVSSVHITHAWKD